MLPVAKRGLRLRWVRSRHWSGINFDDDRVAFYNIGMDIQIIFLARFRERFGVSREAFQLTADIDTVSALLAALRQRGGAFADELAEGRAFRVAVNQEVVALDHRITAGDEVAIFPPVTGG